MVVCKGFALKKMDYLNFTPETEGEIKLFVTIEKLQDAKIFQNRIFFVQSLPYAYTGSVT